ncbi:MAG: hypothetical protein K0S32_4024 [Bacteroidetes bacterium]|nr:hypothetical protein [Bacteroidota bacterium]
MALKNSIFRTRLTLIKGPLEELKTKSSNENDLHNIQLIERNSERLLSLVNQLLDVSKVEAGKFILNKNYGNISGFIEGRLQLFRKTALEKGIHFVTEIKAETIHHLFSPDAIEKIITNLLSNAMKFTSNGGTVSVKSRVENGQLILEVTDTGSGISSNDLPHIFDRFYQAKQTHETGGTGIGLSLTKELVDLMQGTITVNSEKNKGSAFLVKIPIETENTISETETQEEGLIVVLAEDDRELSDFVSSILKKENIHVYAAANGKEGFELATKILPDLIITDVMMPVMDGIELSKKLKADTLTSHIPVIGLSAKSAQESRIKGLESGMDIYLNKPFSPSELLLTVNNISLTIKNNVLKFKDQLREEEKFFKERIAGNDQYILKLVDIIDLNIDDTEFSVNELADKAAISRSQLHRKIKALTGLSTTHFIRMVKLEKAKDLFKTNAGNVTEIAYICGFSSQSYFTKSFVEHFGFPPSDLIKSIS